MEQSSQDRIFSAFMRLKKSVSSIHSDGLTNAMITAMMAIEMHGGDSGVMPTTICRHVGISMPAIARTIKELELRGFVMRAQDKDDRRVFYVRLTNSGRAELEGGKIRIQRRFSRILQILGEEETEQMLKIFDRISDIAEQVKQEDEVQ